ncbi:MAG: hypothetical protein GY833_22525 [Aestuariibacter sp.]|nr:hypothetical protein [Aestuariibacter sp.]|tara:strand:- start:248162 stop:248416 length:255 start_codon:yes stop_codon:yes gene_type:complete
MTTLTTDELLARFRIQPAPIKNDEGDAITLAEFLAEQALKKELAREEMKRRVKAARAAKAPVRARVAFIKARLQIAEMRKQKAA